MCASMNVCLQQRANEKCECSFGRVRQCKCLFLCICINICHHFSCVRLRKEEMTSIIFVFEKLSLVILCNVGISNEVL